ncbi:hypothetical protein [Massilia violaceinigra]|nr:hypothetical protein [Massilia violaceinigra]
MINPSVHVSVKEQKWPGRCRITQASESRLPGKQHPRGVAF